MQPCRAGWPHLVFTVEPSDVESAGIPAGLAGHYTIPTHGFISPVNMFIILT